MYQWPHVSRLSAQRSSRSSVVEAVTIFCAMKLILSIITLCFQVPRWYFPEVGRFSCWGRAGPLALSLSLWAAHPPALSFSGLPPCGPVPLRVTLSALVALGASDQVLRGLVWHKLCLSLCGCLCICLWVCLCLVCVRDSQQASFTQGHIISTCCTTFFKLWELNFFQLVMPCISLCVCLWVCHCICLWACTTGKVVVRLSDGQLKTLRALVTRENWSSQPINNQWSLS